MKNKQKELIDLQREVESKREIISSKHQQQVDVESLLGNEIDNLKAEIEELQGQNTELNVRLKSTKQV